MMPHQNKKVTAKEPWRSGRRGGRVRFPRIAQFTVWSGRNRSHVYRVLTGERKSPVLLKLWEEFHQKAAK